MKGEWQDGVGGWGERVGVVGWGERVGVVGWVGGVVYQCHSSGTLQTGSLAWTSW